MTKRDIKDVVFEVVSDFTINFYEQIMKPELREMIEEVMDKKLDQKFEEKFDEHLGPMKASIMVLEQKVDLAIKDYAGQQLQISGHEKRIIKLEQKPHQS